MISGQTIRAANREEQIRAMASNMDNQKRFHQGGQTQTQKLYTEEDGYLRGARIADKIQEFYHTTGNQTSNNATGKTTFPIQGASSNPTAAARGEIHSQGGVRSLHNKQ